ncbi:MAG TPA: SDR family oxidoreductase [Candidatus Tumulicola sp.]|nr:SDR family oxidoreductase [Candidatus Tumulicola sp.]
MLTGARVLLTGATGRFGRVLASELIRNDCEVTLIVRAPSPETARARVASVLGTDFRQVKLVCGDVTEPFFGASARERAWLRLSTDVVVHAAAQTSFGSSLEIARRANVHATRNTLEFAERMPRLLRFAYVSTAFVAGKRMGRILETELEHSHGFHNAYQQSKYEAEFLVRGRDDVLPVVVLRPAIVLERSDAVTQRRCLTRRRRCCHSTLGIKAATPSSRRALDDETSAENRDRHP